MIKHNKLGKVIDQVGGLRIREIETKAGKEYGLYAGKRLFKQMLNPDTLRVMSHKILVLISNNKLRINNPYSHNLWEEYKSFMKSK